MEERKEKLKEYIKEQSMNNYIEYKRTRATARKIIKQKKKENFIDFVSSLNKNSNIKYVWNKMRVIKNGFKTVEWNKWQIVDRDTTIEKEIDKIAPAWVETGIEEEEEEEDGINEIEESGEERLNK